MILHNISDTCTGLPNESLQTTTTFPVDYGVVVTVYCSELGDSLEGADIITCIKETEFAFTVREPKCEKGELKIVMLSLVPSRVHIISLPEQTSELKNFCFFPSCLP